MNLVSAATTAISEAESAIAGLVQQAVGARKFDEAKQLVDALAALALLKQGLQRDSDVSTRSEQAREALPDLVPAVSLDHASSSRRRQQAEDFPRFHRSGDRLLKIGWSAKERTTYEQRVPRQIVMAVCALMAERIKSKKPFKMEKLLPIIDQDGNEVPSYQAYLVLKWLQHFGAVERRGRDGYVLGPAGLSLDTAGSLWSRTTEQPTTNE
jgi:hypothetical protein